MSGFFTGKRILGIGAVLLVLIACLWVFNNQRFLQDQFAVWSFDPPAEIEALAERTQLSDDGEFLFYASTPTIEGTQAFNELCGLSTADEGYNILGCYDGRVIVIYEIDDPQLDGMMEVTAAHEMLHAAWDRLDRDEQDRIAALLEAEYEAHSDDEEFVERMAWYTERDASSRRTELYAIIGTEFPEISAELEEHYARYFVDRSIVVGLHSQYEAVFQQIQEEADRLNTRADDLSSEIESRTARYESDLAAYNSDVDAFNRAAENGDFASAADFQAQRQRLVSRGAELDGERSAINALVEEYNDVVDALAELSEASAALQDSIDSTLAPPAGVEG